MSGAAVLDATFGDGGGTTQNNWLVPSGTLRGSSDAFAFADVRIGAGAYFVIDQQTDGTLSGNLSGNGVFRKIGTGSLSLTSSQNAFEGGTAVVGGTLNVTGNLGGVIAVSNGGLLSGTGVLGDVVVLTGGSLVGESGQTIKMASLSMLPSSIMSVTLGAPTTSQLFDVAGDVSLDAKLRVNEAPNFGAGTYRLLSYGGGLSGELSLDTTWGASPHTMALQSAVDKKINLIVGTSTGTFWDGGDSSLHDNGTIDGGGGIWAANAPNWTSIDGASNGTLAPSAFAIFDGVGGAVTADASHGALSVAGMQFAADGYSISGDALTLEGPAATIRVGDGTASGKAISATISSALTGNAKLVKSDLGTLVLAGANTYSGGTEINEGALVLTGQLDGSVVVRRDGQLQVGDRHSNGDLLGDVTNDGTLIFNQLADYDYAGALSGDGGLIKKGQGTLLLSGDYSYTGTTVVEGGSIRLASLLKSDTDLVLKSGTFDLGGKTQEIAGLSGEAGKLLLGDGALTVRQTNDSAFSGTIAGDATGSFVKAGAGRLNLTGSSSFTGNVDVNDGRLAINGALPAHVHVNQGGTLGGTGTAGTLVVRNGGTLAPGNSIGTLNVAGNVSFEPGSVYEVEVNADGQSDRIVAGGQATINGGSVKVTAAAGNYRWASDYVILSASGGVTGGFSDYDVDLPFLDPSLSYTANDVVLTLVRNDRSFASAAITPNQNAVALALDASDRTSALHKAVAGQTDVSAARQAFNALSGELWATTGSFMVDRTRRFGEMVTGRLEQADVISHALAGGNSAARQTRDGRTGIWGEAIGSWNTVKSNGNAARATQSMFGFVTGLDHLVGDWRIGVAFSHGEDKVRVDGLSSSATVTSNGLAAYGGGGWGALRARIGATYTWMDVKGSRNLAFPSVSETLSGRYDGKAASAFGELSYAAQIGRVMTEPFAGVNHVHLKTDEFAESGGALGGLSVNGTRRDVTYTTLGLRLGTALPVSNSTVITPRVSAAWLHGYGDVSAKGLHGLTTGQSFAVEGLPATRDALHIEAGAQVNIMPRGSFGISYIGNVSREWRDHGLRIGFSYSF